MAKQLEFIVMAMSFQSIATAAITLIAFIKNLRNFEVILRGNLNL
jgi:hypothetical protein